tara:strand:- start:1227 stop:1655 length:429 start_codon:yes stop_codon:yes gene_type:complete
MLISKIYSPLIKNENKIAFYNSSVPAGFPSPAEDHMDIPLDLNEHLIRHPAATFYVYAKGNSMQNSGIYDGDLLIVDRAVEPKLKNIVIAVIDGEFTVKRISKIKNKIYLLPDNKEYHPIEIKDISNFQIWGVVIYTIHKPL